MWKIVSIIKVNLSGSDLNSVISNDILPSTLLALVCYNRVLSRVII